MRLSVPVSVCEGVSVYLCEGVCMRGYVKVSVCECEVSVCECA